ncbi:polysaccharide deacetylase family protein [Paenibacillus abyssi]|uniref:NodB homology domain-containing protein n=1 Tax=Paenibacillus abyssi TaxID=1340531 RepID=A0A917G0S0_9BACL|nr:polysaccharide deacetylase family protein [Paenibacillus abyssi]GGG17170.1 hypothetical protein GCM10010916_37530 [Paenibacillus abyssi]
MRGSLFKRVAVVAICTVIFLLWLQTTEELYVGSAAGVAEESSAGAGDTITVIGQIGAAPSVRGEAFIQPAKAKVETETEAERMPAAAHNKQWGNGDPNGGDPAQPTVYLTFDDGPSKWTPQVLDILQEHGVKATFFVLGKLVEEREETARRIVSEGHSLGNHTYDHEYTKLYGSSFLGFWEQVQQTDEAIFRVTGERVRILRAPGGTFSNFDALYFYYMQEAGYEVHDWTMDSGDSKRRGVPAQEIINNVKKAKLTHTVNLLMHDSAGHQETVKALPEIIRYFKDKGYRFAALTDQVKPVTFRVGNIKWDRSPSERQHEQILDMIRKADSSGYQAPAVKPNAAAAAMAKEPPKMDEREWIALRDWARGKGTVMWDPASKTAALTLNGAALLFHPGAGNAAWVESGRTEASVDLPIKFTDNRWYVLKAQADALAAELET